MYRRILVCFSVNMGTTGPPWQSGASSAHSFDTGSLRYKWKAHGSLTVGTYSMWADNNSLRVGISDVSSCGLVEQIGPSNQTPQRKSFHGNILAPTRPRNTEIFSTSALKSPTIFPLVTLSQMFPRHGQSSESLVSGGNNFRPHSDHQRSAPWAVCSWGWWETVSQTGCMSQRRLFDLKHHIERLFLQCFAPVLSVAHTDTPEANKMRRVAATEPLTIQFKWWHVEGLVWFSSVIKIVDGDMEEISWTVLICTSGAAAGGRTTWYTGITLSAFWREHCCVTTLRAFNVRKPAHWPFIRAEHNDRLQFSKFQS